MSSGEKIPLQTPKRCSCGCVYVAIPAEHKITEEDGITAFWWNCLCNSTLYVPIIPVPRKKAA